MLKRVNKETGMAVTLKEIAELAGVSPSTASHAIRGINPGKRALSDETIQKVRSCAEKLGYRPNLLAASLAQSKTFTIGVIVSVLRGNFYERVLDGITEVVYPEFTTLLSVHNYNPERERRELEVFIGKRVDGIIATCSGCKENADIYREIIDKYRIPLVLVDRGLKGVKCPIVRSDHFQSTYLATREYVSLGHKSIAFVAAGRETESTQILKDGYIAAMNDCGFAEYINVITKKTDIWGLSELRQFAREIINSCFSAEVRPTALLLQADWLAYEVMAECDERGIKIPDDLSIMGMEDCDPSSLPAISLSTVKVPLTEVGKTAAQVLTTLIDGKPLESDKVLIKPSIVLRKTTARISG